MKVFFPIALFGCLLPLSLAAQVKETPVVIGLVEGGNPQGYIQGSNDQGVIFATAAGGGGQLLPYARIRGEGLEKLIRYGELTEMMAGPRALYTDGDYAGAAEAFGKVARDYAIILAAPSNFASEALFYQIESLKRAGQYAAMAPLVESPAAATIATKLPAAYQRDFELHKMWALLGKGDHEGLKSALEAYQEPQIGDRKLLKTPSFKKLPPAEVAQLSFLRARAYEAEGAKDKALEDYCRSFTLAFGNDVLLAKQSMTAAMQILKDDPRLAEGNPVALSEMRSLAYFYSKRFGKDSLPADLQVYAVKPPVERIVPPKEEGDAKAPKEEKKAEEKKPEAKAPKEEKPK